MGRRPSSPPSTRTRRASSRSGASPASSTGTRSRPCGCSPGDSTSGRLIAVAALRPAGADGHGEELVAGALGDLESFEQLAETLLSTEYGSDGLPRRVGLELYRSEGGMPIRVAGDATATADLDAGGVRRTSAALHLRAAGAAGAGALDILRPA